MTESIRNIAIIAHVDHGKTTLVDQLLRLYDDLNRLTNMAHQFGTTNLAAYSYMVDATGRRTNAVEILRQEDNTYQTNTLRWRYDAMYRLTNEINTTVFSGGTYSYTNAYLYDSVGNRMQMARSGDGADTNSYAYNANDELLTNVSVANGANTYLYDENGSLTNKTSAAGVDSYTYDLANKLNGAWANGSQEAAYYCNDDGIRVESMNGNATNHFLIDANNQTGYAQVLEELPAIGATPTMSYVIGADVLAQCGTTATAPAYFLQDGHGNNRQLAQNGAIADHYTYDTYGAVQSSVSTSTAEYAASDSTKITSKLFCGEQYDANLQMYNLRARYYDPAIGRFNKRDTFAGDNEDPQSLHKYLYCNSDPVNEIDPAGQQGTMVEAMATFEILALGFAFVSAVAEAAFQDATLRLGIIQTEQMLLSGAANLAGDAYNAAVTEAALLVSQTQMVMNAIQNAINQAIKAGIRKTVDELKRLPIYLVSRSLTPSIFGFTNWCLSARPDWFVLAYNGRLSPRTDANRKWMWTTYAPFWLTTPPGFKVDEFPFASTAEGGFGGPARITYVPTKPVDENSRQGGLLRAFYYISLRGKPGPFLVVPVP